MTDRLEGIDLVVFDKDGTLIGFDSMWRGWALELGDRLSRAVGRDVRPPLYAMLGFDVATGMVAPHGGLAATPMARLRETTHALLIAGGSSEADASAAMVSLTWVESRPSGSGHPLPEA